MARTLQIRENHLVPQNAILALQQQANEAAAFGRVIADIGAVRPASTPGTRQHNQQLKALRRQATGKQSYRKRQRSGRARRR